MQSLATLMDEQAEKAKVESMAGAPPGTREFHSTQRYFARQQERTSLDDLEITHPHLQGAIDAARKWADRMRDGQLNASLVLVGGNGTGKTSIARAILWSITDVAVDFKGDPMPNTRQPAGRFFMAGNLILMLGDYHNQRTGMNYIVRTHDVFGKAPIIVIDDVGAEPVIPYVGLEQQDHERKARYFKVIEHCYTHGRAVIMTGSDNCDSLEKLHAHLGDRCWNRLLEMAPKGFMRDLSQVPSWRVTASGRTQDSEEESHDE